MYFTIHALQYLGLIIIVCEFYQILYELMIFFYSVEYYSQFLQRIFSNYDAAFPWHIFFFSGSCSS